MLGHLNPLLSAMPVVRGWVALPEQKATTE
jgi:hypothetical protein